MFHGVCGGLVTCSGTTGQVPVTACKHKGSRGSSQCHGILMERENPMTTTPDVQVGLDLIAEAAAANEKLCELVAKAPPEVLDEVRPMLAANVRRRRELLADYL